MGVADRKRAYWSLVVVSMGGSDATSTGKPGKTISGSEGRSRSTRARSEEDQETRQGMTPARLLVDYLSLVGLVWIIGYVIGVFKRPKDPNETQ